MKLAMVIIIFALWTLVRACRNFSENITTMGFSILPNWILYPIHAIIALITGMIVPGLIFVLIFLRYF